MDLKVKVSLAILEEAAEEGEDLEFSEMLEEVASRLDEEARQLLSSLEGLGYLPPRVAIWRLMNDEGWGEAFREASRLFVERMLSL